MIIELKTEERLTPVHVAHVRTYLRITRLTLGLLLNFNSAVLKDGLKRVILERAGHSR